MASARLKNYCENFRFIYSYCLNDKYASKEELAGINIHGLMLMQNLKATNISISLLKLLQSTPGIIMQTFPLIFNPLK